jgi:hypothetical protein
VEAALPSADRGWLTREQPRQARRADPARAVLQRLRLAFELYDLAEWMMRTRLARTVPPDEVEAALDRWRMDRPGAPDGDGPGRGWWRGRAGAPGARVRGTDGNPVAH